MSDGEAQAGDPEPGAEGNAQGKAHELSAEQRRALWTVAFTLFLDLAGFGIILPVLPFYAEHHGASPAMVSLLSTAFSLAQFVMSPVLGRLSDKHGRRPVMLISIAGSIAAGLVLGFAQTLWMVFVARIVSGSAKANVSTAYAYVADMVPPRNRAKYMGLMGAALGMGFVFGPAIGGLLSLESMPTLPFFVSAGLAAVNLLMAYVWLPESRTAEERAAHPPQKRQPVVQTLRRLSEGPMGWLVVVTFLFFFGFANMESVFALFTERAFGWGAQETGIFLTFMGVCMVISQGLIVGRAVDRLGELRVLLVGTLALAVGFAMLGGGGVLVDLLGMASSATVAGASTGRIVTLGLGAMLMATGNGFMNATLGALVSKVSTESDQGLNMGLRASSAALARISGPVLAGVLFQFVDHAAPLIFAAGLGVLNFLVASMFMRASLRRAGVEC